MPVRQIVPKEDGEASCDVSVQKSPNFILPRKIRVRTRRFLDRCEPLKQKITIALLQLPDELENRRVDQQACASLVCRLGNPVQARLEFLRGEPAALVRVIEHSGSISKLLCPLLLPKRDEEGE